MEFRPTLVKTGSAKLVSPQIFDLTQKMLFGFLKTNIGFYPFMILIQKNLLSIF